MPKEPVQPEAPAPQPPPQPEVGNRHEVVLEDNKKYKITKFGDGTIRKDMK